MTNLSQQHGIVSQSGAHTRLLRHTLCGFHPLAAFFLAQPRAFFLEQPSPSLLPALSPSWLRQPEAGLHQRHRQMGNKAKLCKVCNAFKFRMAVDERFCMCCGCTNPTGCCNHPRGKRTCRNPIFKRGAIQCSACRATYKLHRAAGAADAAVTEATINAAHAAVAAAVAATAAIGNGPAMTLSATSALSHVPTLTIQSQNHHPVPSAATAATTWLA